MSQTDPSPCAGVSGPHGRRAEPAEIAKLFSENMEWETAGDGGVLRWIGK